MKRFEKKIANGNVLKLDKNSLQHDIPGFYCKLADSNHKISCEGCKKEGGYECMKDLEDCKCRDWTVFELNNLRDSKDYSRSRWNEDGTLTSVDPESAMDITNKPLEYHIP
eukprot:UN10632